LTRLANLPLPFVSILRPIPIGLLLSLFRQSLGFPPLPFVLFCFVVV
jgi:hypothetical protein